MLSGKRNKLRFDGWVLEPFLDHSLSEKFDCGDDDLNEFFRKDLAPHEKELLTKTYMLTLERATGVPVALISFCNDSIRLKSIEESIELPDAKKYPYLPAVKIARIGVRADLCGKGIGSHLLNMTKILFLKENRTGCRILTVDAYNKERVLNFYKKNHFDFVTPKDSGNETRTMFYDLMRTIITPSIDANRSIFFQICRKISKRRRSENRSQELLLESGGKDLTLTRWLTYSSM